MTGVFQFAFSLTGRFMIKAGILKFCEKIINESMFQKLDRVMCRVYF